MANKYTKKQLKQLANNAKIKQSIKRSKFQRGGRITPVRKTRKGIPSNFARVNPRGSSKVQPGISPNISGVQMMTAHQALSAGVASTPKSNLSKCKREERIDESHVRKYSCYINDLSLVIPEPGIGIFSGHHNEPNEEDFIVCNAYCGSSCFIAGTKVKMVDGTEKNIEDIVVGDRVLGENNSTNTVNELDWTILDNRKLYSFNDEDNYFVTSEHPFKTIDGWRSINPYATKLESVDLFNQLTGDLDKGNILLTFDGKVKLKSIDEKEMDNPELPLYNFHLDGDNSYYADGYLVHNKGECNPDLSTVCNACCHGSPTCLQCSHFFGFPNGDSAECAGMDGTYHYGSDCDDNPPPCGVNIVDCAGICNGGATGNDCCGNFVWTDACVNCGDNIASDACDCAGNINDCAGECGGSAVEDGCGICNGNGCDDCTTCSCDDYCEDDTEYSSGSSTCMGYDDCSPCVYGTSNSCEGDTCGGGNYCLNNLCGGLDDPQCELINESCDSATGECYCVSGITDCNDLCDGAAIDDCAGECGGDLSNDECGVCGGNGYDDWDCNDEGSTCWDMPDGDCDCDENVDDCNGDCGGSAVEDECGVCNGDCTSCDVYDYCVCGIEIDECGVCGGDGIVDGACDCDGNVDDCNGDCGGSAVEDECGVCNGDGSTCIELSIGFYQHPFYRSCSQNGYWDGWDGIRYQCDCYNHQSGPDCCCDWLVTGNCGYVDEAACFAAGHDICIMNNGCWNVQEDDPSSWQYICGGNDNECGPNEFPVGYTSINMVAADRICQYHYGIDAVSIDSDCNGGIWGTGDRGSFADTYPEPPNGYCGASSGYNWIKSMTCQESFKKGGRLQRGGDITSQNRRNKWDI